MSLVEGLVVIVLILSTTMIAGLIIQRSSHNGSIVISRDEDSGKLTFSLEFDGDPYDIPNMKEVSFRVVKKDNAE